MAVFHPLDVPGPVVPWSFAPALGSAADAVRSPVVRFWPASRSLMNDWRPILNALSSLFSFTVFNSVASQASLLVLDKQRWTILTLLFPCMASVVWLGLSSNRCAVWPIRGIHSCPGFRGLTSWIAVFGCVGVGAPLPDSPPSAILPLMEWGRAASTWFIKPAAGGSRWPGFVGCA